MQPNTTKTVQFAPHLAPFAGIAVLIGVDPVTFKQIEGSTGLTKRDQLQRAIGIADMIPLLDIKKYEHLDEATKAGAKLIDTMKRSRLHDREMFATLVDHIVGAGNKLSYHYHQKQNGTGDAPAVQTQQKPGAPSVSTGTHAQ